MVRGFAREFFLVDEFEHAHRSRVGEAHAALRIDAVHTVANRLQNAVEPLPLGLD